jgi:hypothetical protein
MADITIAKGATTYTIRNFEVCNVSYDAPAITIDIPEEATVNDAVIITAVNTPIQKAVIVWKLIDEPTSVVDTSTVKTADEQVTFLTGSFRPFQISDTYTVTIGAYSHNGRVTRLNLDKTSDSPSTWRGTIEVTIGTVIG